MAVENSISALDSVQLERVSVWLWLLDPGDPALKVAVADFRNQVKALQRYHQEREEKAKAARGPGEEYW